MVGNDGVEVRAPQESDPMSHTHMRTREERRAENRAAWGRDPRNGNVRAPPELPDDVPERPESAEECARQAADVAWGILHGAAKDADRMNAARFFMERAKESAKAPGEVDPDPLGTLARAQGGER